MLGEFFDPKGDRLETEHWRPHWSQAGAVVFITFRTFDSIPREVIERWDREKREWLLKRRISVRTDRPVLASDLADEVRSEFQRTFNRCREDFLDRCAGRCLLRRSELAQIVADSLLHFDGERYRMGDFVVMPNHAHLLAAFPTEEAMRVQCDSWLHYTAFRINQSIGDRGRSWQQEPFDHLVRSPDQYDYLRRYIVDNPRRARLKVGEFLYRRFEG